MAVQLWVSNPLGQYPATRRRPHDRIDGTPYLARRCPGCEAASGAADRHRSTRRRPHDRIMAPYRDPAFARNYEPRFRGHDARASGRPEGGERRPGRDCAARDIDGLDCSTQHAQARGPARETTLDTAQRHDDVSSQRWVPSTPSLRTQIGSRAELSHLAPTLWAFPCKPTRWLRARIAAAQWPCYSLVYVGGGCV